MTRILKISMLAAGLALVACATTISQPEQEWTDAELTSIRSLWIETLEPLPAHSNAYADDPRAVELGHRLFFDTRLSSNGEVSCASCHQPQKGFEDGLALAVGVGTTGRRTPTIIGTSNSPWQFWDGRKDSPWSQALGPLESPVEHGGSRAQYAHAVAANYRTEYEAIFGALPDLRGIPATAGPVNDPVARSNWERLGERRRDDVNRVFANIGKAIAAYERQIKFGPSRFDRFVEGLARPNAERVTLSRDEEAGLRIFIGRGQCVQCHNGPMLTDNSFHNIGVPARAGKPHDRGRIDAIARVTGDEFNERGRYSDASADDPSELDFIVRDGHELVGAFKTPTLRGVADRGPYMHAGQFSSLREVLRHYNDAPAAGIGHSELKALRLDDRELAQLEAFLRSLSAPLAAPAHLLSKPDEVTAMSRSRSTGTTRSPNGGGGDVLRR
jgi:cytochrome c peroxidase